MVNDDTEGLRLSLKQHGRWMSLKDFLEGRRTAQEAGEAMGFCVRHVRRLAKRARSVGVRCLVHGNRGRPSNHRLKQKTIRKISGLYRAKYAGFNLTHFREQLVQREKMKAPPCRESIRCFLEAQKLWARRRKAPKHRQRRPRREREGEMLQIDASLHLWFGDDQPALTLVGATFTRFRLRYHAPPPLTGSSR